MFKKILVPLDGSVEAETVLPYVRDLACHFGSEVDVLSVARGSKRSRINQLLDGYVHNAVEHLQEGKIACKAVMLFDAPLFNGMNNAGFPPASGVKTKGKAVAGGTAENILNYARTHHTSLIVMASHGLGGLTQLWLGSVFEKVVSGSIIPVLGIHSRHVKESERHKSITFKRILAPLDGSDAGEAALHYAEAIALKTGASMILVHVVPKPHIVEERILGPEFTHFVKAMHETGEKYLKRVENRLAAKGLDVSIEVLSGDPAEVIADRAKRDKADLIAMSTHGRSGIARWVLGSVADKILHETKIPLWLVRPRRIISEMIHNGNHRVN